MSTSFVHRRKGASTGVEGFVLCAQAHIHRWMRPGAIDRGRSGLPDIDARNGSCKFGAVKF
jgi:hypothetical protein